MEGVIMFDYRRVVRTFGLLRNTQTTWVSQNMLDGPQVMAMMVKNVINQEKFGYLFANIY